MPGQRPLVPLQPKPLLSVRTEKQDLDDVPLVAEDLIQPARVAGTGETDLILVSPVAEDQARLRELCEQSHHLVATCQVLVEIAEIRAQVLQVGLLVDELGAVQCQW